MEPGAPGVRRSVSLSGGDVIAAGGGAVATALGGFLFAFVVARALGPSGTGLVMAYATWFTALAVIGKVGMDTALVYACARSVAGVEPASPRRLLAWSLGPALALTIGMSVLIWVNAEWLGPLIMGGSAIPDLEALVRVGCVALPMAVVTILALSALRGAGSTKPLIIVDQVVKPVARLVFALLVVMLGQATATSVTWAWLASVPLCLVLTIPAWTRLAAATRAVVPAGEGAPENRDQRTSRSGLYRFALPRMPAQVADILNASIGIMFLSTLGTATETGLFTAALRLTAGGLLALQAIRLVIAPILAFELSLDRVEAAQRVYGSAAALIVASSWPVYLVFLCAPTAVLRIFGAEFGAAWPSLVVLTLGCMILAFFGNMQAAVLMSGGSSRALLATGAGLVTNLVATVGLLPSIGGLAAAVGWTIGVCTEAIILWLAIRKLGLHPGPPPVRRMALRALLVLFPACLAAGLFWPVSHVAALAVALLGFGAYVLVVREPARSAWRALTAERAAQRAGEQR